MSLSILPAYSPADTGAVDTLAAPAYDDVKGAPDPAPVALSADGFIRSCPLDEIVERFLSHMLEAVAALRLTRNSISFCLTEETAFIRPPWARDRVDESFKDGAGVRRPFPVSSSCCPSCPHPC